jgi:hypothetical protein
MFDCSGMSGGTISNPFLEGFPYTMTNNAATQYAYFHILEPTSVGVSSGYKTVYFRMSKNSSTALLLQSDGGGHSLGAYFQNGSNFRGQGFYFTD